MGEANGGSQGFWPREEGGVPLASAAALKPPAANGSRAEDARGNEPSRARSSSRGAAEFTAERMIRPTTEAPTGGWRRTLFVLTGGRVTLGPSPAEVRHRELV